MAAQHSPFDYYKTLLETSSQHGLHDIQSIRHVDTVMARLSESSAALGEIAEHSARIVSHKQRLGIDDMLFEKIIDVVDVDTAPLLVELLEQSGEHTHPRSLLDKFDSAVAIFRKKQKKKAIKR